jgi:hypothetical protein
MLTPYVSRLGPRAGQPGAIRPRRRGRFEPPAPAPIDGLSLAPGLEEQASDAPLVPEALEVFAEIETGAGVALDGGDVAGSDAPPEPHGRFRPGVGLEPAEPDANRTERGPAGRGPSGPEIRTELAPEIRTGPGPRAQSEPGPGTQREPGPQTRTGPGPGTRREPGPENRSEPAGIEPVPAPEPPTRARPADSQIPPAAPRRPTSGASGPRDAAPRSLPSGAAPTTEPATEPAIGEPAIGEPAIESASVISVPASAASPAPGRKREPRTHGTVADDRAGTRPPVRSSPGTSVPPEEHADGARHSREETVRATRSGALGRAASDEAEPTTRRPARTPPEPMWAARPAPPPPPVGHSPSQGAGRPHATDVPNTDVTVAIGRVEVRVPPAPPARQRPSRPRRQPPSLEQYLEARARGLAG